MIYPKITFPIPKNRPFFYTNFVSTIDGKVIVTKDPKSYWPIGSRTDYRTLLELRSYADILIHGKHTAMWHRTVDSLSDPAFHAMRKKKKKPGNLSYMVVSNHPDDSMIPFLETNEKDQVIVMTNEKVRLSAAFSRSVQIVRIGKESVPLADLAGYLHRNGYRNILVEGGPTLLGAFIAHDLIDEIFLTVAPKIFGNSKHDTLTLVEGGLLPPEKIKICTLLSHRSVGDEIFLRYRINRP